MDDRLNSGSIGGPVMRGKNPRVVTAYPVRNEALTGNGLPGGAVIMTHRA